MQKQLAQMQQMQRQMEQMQAELEEKEITTTSGGGEYGMQGAVLFFRRFLAIWTVH